MLGIVGKKQLRLVMNSRPSSMLVMMISLAIGSVVITTCSFVERRTHPDSARSWDASEFRAFDIERVEMIARESALQWKEDAILTEIDIPFWPKSASVQPLAFVGYNSMNDPTIWFSGKIEIGANGDFVLAGTSTGEFSDPRPQAEEIDASKLNLSVDRVLQISLSDPGGFDERVINQAEWPGSIEISRLDDYGFTGPIVWSVSAGSLWSGAIQHVIIADQEGEIIETKIFGE